MHPVTQRLRGVLLRRPWLAPTALALLAGVLLLVRLDEPGRIIFDETYYVEDAIGYLDNGVEPTFAVHPTLGKWLIAGSIWLLGDDPFGWRFVGAMSGVGTVVLTYLLARRLLRDAPNGWWLAPLAPVLLLADGLFLTQARIAMLDIHLVLFATAGAHVLVMDRDRRRAATEPQRPVLSLRVLAGVLFGLAIAVKWSGLLALGGAGLLTIGWELGDVRGRPWWVLPRRAVAVLGSLVVVPAAVYALTWVPWLVGYEHSSTAGCSEGETCEYSIGDRVAGLARHHDAMLGFHLNLEATHNYRSDPLGWVVLERPVVYFWESCSQERAAAGPTEDPETGELEPACEVPVGDAAEVIALGNPALWWGFLLLLPLLVGGTVLRDRRSAVPLVMWLGTWLPWLAVSRTAFLFYMSPAVPMLAIGTVVALQRLGDPVPVRRTYLGAAGGAGLGLVVAGALLLLDIGDGPRLLAGLGGSLAALGAAIGTVADRERARSRAVEPAAGPSQAWPSPASPPGAQHGEPASSESTAGRWALLVGTLVVGTAVWFAPVWYGVVLDHDTVSDRWWFDSWV